MNREEREATLLFADLRGSTELVTSLEADEAFELLGDVMDCLTAAVLDHDGVVIDYYGDGLAAMWNAPDDQAEHAELACRAALHMSQTLPDVSADWKRRVSSDLQLAIGVHTGKVHVGNAGSRRHSKYGPRGPNVHLASRLVAAAKMLRLPLIVSQATADRLFDKFGSHRICRVRMRGVDKSIGLYSVSMASADIKELAAWEAYDSALHLFEQGNFAEAASVLQTLDASNGAIPVHFLIGEVNRALGTYLRRRSTDARSEFDGTVALVSR
jgi:adenylate cyclase